MSAAVAIEHPDDRYCRLARQDPRIARIRKQWLQSIGLHLWCMSVEELAAATPESVRAAKRLDHCYITDDEIAAEIAKERVRPFIDPITGAVTPREAKAVSA